ncbi:MAG: Diphthamide biosynthesis protein 2 [Pycnora praestabilis]|nr:MAG: Diphthamide biosynthesis protein 2 [Pycnora praestabilis]
MNDLATAPILSTPDTHIFGNFTSPAVHSDQSRLSDEELFFTYEIERTVSEIRRARWRRIALQFPDEMLVDAPRVYQALSRGFRTYPKTKADNKGNEANTEASALQEFQDGVEGFHLAADEAERRLYILADTSYGACCVDEIAAEHVDAEGVVHYGRACLSPTARLPVIHVFTTRPLSLDSVVEAFVDTYLAHDQKVVLMADVTYSNHIPQVYRALATKGYVNIYPTSIIHDPSSPLPNRTIPDDVANDSDALREYQLFHISEPPTSLLLTLSSRLAAIHIYPTNIPQSSPPKTLLVSTNLTLRRRYALLTSLNTVSIFGILINTLSVKNYLHIVDHVKLQIAAAGKKSYTFVVGKVNAAKVANFSEIGGWVVIGCWESSLVESKDFWKPIITPFELELALQGDGQRVWTGKWTGDYQGILDRKIVNEGTSNGHGEDGVEEHAAHDNDAAAAMDGGDLDSEEESAPPEFDLRTGRYVSHSRPMQAATTKSSVTTAHRTTNPSANTALIKRANGDLATVGGEVSPGAEYLRSQRTWKGLGDDFEIAYEEEDGSGAASRVNGAQMEQGRSGIARGYTVGEEGTRR